MADHDLGIRTTRAVPVEALGLPAGRAGSANRYEPTPYGVLEDMLLGLDVDEPRTTFVDVGCGKGRIVCVAAGRHFARVVGIELSEALCEVARDNVARLSQRYKRAKAIEIRHQDAASLVPPRGPAVFFLFNPFGPDVLARVARAVATNPARDPRWLLYYMPVHEDVLTREAGLEPAGRERDRQRPRQWVVYRSG